jgi:hypothetical protein
MVPPCWVMGDGRARMLQDRCCEGCVGGREHRCGSDRVEVSGAAW